MKNDNFNKTAVATAVGLVIAAAALKPAAADNSTWRHGNSERGEYLTGDFHNHTTCSDGSTSVRTLTRKSLSYLDWFIHVGHSGSGSRDCRVDDFLYLNRDSEFNRGLWINSADLGLPEAQIKGDPTFQTMRTGTQVPAMWRWQSLQEFNFQDVIAVNDDPRFAGKTSFLGVEWVVPGHEHSSNTVATGQFDPSTPNADALAQFEYCFASNSEDTSGGGGQGWTCELSDAGNEKVKALFAGRPEEGVADYNSTLVGGINTDDLGQHVKSAAALVWTEEHFPGDGMAVQAHVERQGAFLPGDNRGYNVEHLRDWNTIAPTVAFGFESQPGHQAVPERGSYAAGRPASGLWTYGGTGCYAAAEAAKPGKDFDGSRLTADDFLDGGSYADVPDDMDPARVTVCRPGVRTMWDAMLSEGRKYWFFASSDWHSRGAFGPLDYESSNDFWPGEYQEQFTRVVDNPDRDPAQDLVDGLRSGNTYSVQGQLIDKLEFQACSNSVCATMGETLEVPHGSHVQIYVKLRDPKGPNNGPYTFDNPSLSQIGIQQPLNEPKLAQVDLIGGRIHSMYEPGASQYYNPLAPKATKILTSWSGGALPGNQYDGYMEGRYFVRANKDSYVRLRGTNIPAGTPNERDLYGNPLPDNLSDNIPCDDPACPPHVEGILDMDVEAWADLWFYSNPIFIDVREDGDGEFVASAQ